MEAAASALAALCSHAASQEALRRAPIEWGAVWYIGRGSDPAELAQLRHAANRASRATLHNLQQAAVHQSCCITQTVQQGLTALSRVKQVAAALERCLVRFLHRCGGQGCIVPAVPPGLHAVGGKGLSMLEGSCLCLSSKEAELGQDGFAPSTQWRLLPKPSLSPTQTTPWLT